MTDLTFCYLHMTRHDLDILDTIGTPDYLQGELSDDEVDVPQHMVPPNPDETDVLPSQVHPSYPYGNPLNIKHPAARPRRPYDPSSRALFEDMGYAGGGANGALRWKELALDLLFPVDEALEEADKAAQARKMASGTSSNNPPQHADPAPPQNGTEDGQEGDENNSGGEGGDDDAADSNPEEDVV